MYLDVGKGLILTENNSINSDSSEWMETIGRVWLDDPLNGFFGQVPLTTIALKDFDDHDIVNSFAVVPDANWYMIRSLYLHHIDDLANKFTLAHLKKYNMEWDSIPVAPEGRRRDFSLFGDQYSNFNAGKILLLLEGIGGLSYSTTEDSFVFAENLPTEWNFMEFRVPVQNSNGEENWIKARAERMNDQDDPNRIIKTVIIESNSFKKLTVQPWLENGELISATPNEDISAPPGHAGWTFIDENDAIVVITIEK